MNGKRLLKILAITLCTLLLSSCSGTYPWFRSEALPPLQGQVIDEVTDKPIEGAIILVRWEAYGGAGNHFCTHVVTAISNNEGRYVSPGWEDWEQQVRTTRKSPIVYKPGYEEGRASETEGVLYLKRSTLSPEARLEYLSCLNEGTRCSAGGESNFNRYIYARAIYNEAKSLPVTETDIGKRRLKGLKMSTADAYVSKDEPLSAREYEERIEQFYKEELNE